MRGGRGRAPAVGTALVLVAVLAGCGGTSGHHGDNGAHDGGMMGSGGMTTGRSGSMPTEQAPAERTAPPGAAPPEGRALFLSSGCGGCHTLAAAGATGTAGPNLDRARPSFELVVRQVTRGGGGMPAFATSLTEAQIRMIARYVADSAS